MKATNYTEAYHAEALIEILETKNLCLKCPKHNGHSGEFAIYTGLLQVRKVKQNIRRAACAVCKDFVGAYTCPCIALGAKEAQKRSWLALEEGGYLD